MSWLLRALRTVSPHPTAERRASLHDADALRSRVAALETHVKALYDETAQLRSEQARREAEHGAMVDQLARLYKRVTTRILREAGSSSDSEESPLQLRHRIRGS